MSSGSHLTKDMHDLIKSIGETRSKQEEDKIITDILFFSFLNNSNKWCKTTS